MCHAYVLGLCLGLCTRVSLLLHILTYKKKKKKKKKMHERKHVRGRTAHVRDCAYIRSHDMPNVLFLVLIYGDIPFNNVLPGLRVDGVVRSGDTSVVAEEGIIHVCHVFIVH